MVVSANYASPVTPHITFQNLQNCLNGHKEPREYFMVEFGDMFHSRHTALTPAIVTMKRILNVMTIEDNENTDKAENSWSLLTPVMLNKLRCHAHF